MQIFLRRAWHFVRWPLLVLLLLYIGLVIWRVPAALDKQKADAMVIKIHAQKITLADVMGANLPPPPDPQENNATVAGIDKNDNGVRDDVELAIFKEYPNSAKIRAAELQYALAEQLFLTSVFDKATWVAAAEEEARSIECIDSLYPRGTGLGADLKKYIQIVTKYSDEIANSVFNTQMRKNAEDQAYSFTTSVGTAPGVSCDVDLSTLPN
jgi:hypothetical protein